jgi:hypothetical protein
MGLMGSVAVTICFCFSKLTFVMIKGDCVIADSMAKLSE